jgi:8-oxo-dGTP diphosphatase
MKKFTEYKNPSLSVDIVLFGYDGLELSVLLLNRKEAPYINQWTLPGGFVHIDETFLETTERILTSKAGISKAYLEQLYSFDDPERDPRGRVVSVAYFGLVNPRKYKIVAGHAANGVEWFNINALPKLGFDHGHIFKTALKRLQAKATYEPVGFELLNKSFTLSELQHLYESVLQTEINKRNFRKHVLESGLIKETGKKVEGAKNRPPSLYEFDQKKYHQLKKEHYQFKIQIK